MRGFWYNDYSMKLEQYGVGADKNERWEVGNAFSY